VLFVCTANRMRSRTAEKMYADDDRFEVRSAGTSEFAYRMIDGEILRWADLVVVMEPAHVQNIRSRFPDLYREKRIVSLDIPDIYDYMDPSLMGQIRKRFEKVYKKMI